jgi:hypothetical protein
LAELCIHIANVFYLASFLLRDMLWLRILTCFGMVLGIVFFTCQPMPLYGPTIWHLVFLAINAFQIRRLVLDRRQLRLTEEQERFGAAAFEGLSREELLTLLTRVTCREPQELHHIPQLCQQPLAADERVLRDVAFSRLSRSELLNLLTRRFWNSLRIRRRRPARWWRRRRGGDAGISGDHALVMAPASAEG